MIDDYNDIIDMPHHVSVKHPRMSALDRAAQFAPFSALTGYGETVSEVGRITDKRIELDEYEIELIDRALRAVKEISDQMPVAEITFFVPDNHKSGGAYHTVTDRIIRIDDFERTVILSSNAKIKIDDIVKFVLIKE